MFQINVKPNTVTRKPREQVAKSINLVDEINSDFNGFAECNNCKQAILLPNGVYCGKMRYNASKISECSFFDPEPIEYKLFRRT